MWRYCACYIITFVTRLLEKAAISQEQRFSYSNFVIWSLCMGMCQLTNPWPPLPPNRDSKLEPPSSPVKTCVGSCGQTHRPLCRIFRPYVVLPIWQCHRLPVLYQSFRKKRQNWLSWLTVAVLFWHFLQLDKTVKFVAAFGCSFAFSQFPFCGPFLHKHVIEKCYN